MKEGININYGLLVLGPLAAPPSPLSTLVGNLLDSRVLSVWRRTTAVPVPHADMLTVFAGNVISALGDADRRGAHVPYRDS